MLVMLFTTLGKTVLPEAVISPGRQPAGIEQAVGVASST
jgi:hypothetical protein